MTHKIVKSSDVPKKEKIGVKLAIYPNIGDCEFVVVETETGHNQEFYNIESTMTYIVLEGAGSFFLDDEEIPVAKGDFISIAPNTHIYYKGTMKLILVSNPPWKEENAVVTKPTIW